MELQCSVYKLQSTYIRLMLSTDNRWPPDALMSPHVKAQYGTSVKPVLSMIRSKDTTLQSRFHKHLTRKTNVQAAVKYLVTR